MSYNCNTVYHLCQMMLGFWFCEKNKHKRQHVQTTVTVGWNIPSHAAPNVPSPFPPSFSPRFSLSCPFFSSYRSPSRGNFPPSPSYLTPSLSPSIFSIPPQPFPPCKDPLLKSISRGSWKRCQLPAGLGGARTTIPGVYWAKNSISHGSFVEFL